MRQKTLLVMGSSVMPRQLLQSPRSPFLGSFTMTPLFQSSGISSVSHISWRIRCNSRGVATVSELSISAQTPFSPGALPFFSFCMALVTSPSVMGPRLMSRSASAASISASAGGSGSFQNALSIFPVLLFLPSGLIHQLLSRGILVWAMITSQFLGDLVDGLHVLPFCCRLCFS